VQAVEAIDDFNFMFPLYNNKSVKDKVKSHVTVILQKYANKNLNITKEEGQLYKLSQIDIIFLAQAGSGLAHRQFLVQFTPHPHESNRSVRREETVFI